MNIKSFGISLVVATTLSFSLAGCGEESSDSESSASSNLGNGTVTESSASNDVHTLAQSVGFENNKFSINGVTNSSTDTEDWFVFTAPENGRYSCGMKYADNIDISFNLYHQGHTDMGGTIGSRLRESDDYKDAGYKETETPAVATENSDNNKLAPITNFEISTNEKVYMKVIANSTGGNDISYQMECVTPTMYSNLNQTGTVNENNTIINYYLRTAHPVTLDSNNQVTINGIINSSTDSSDFFKFTTVNAGDYNVTLSGKNNVNIDVELYNPDGSDKGNFSNGNDANDSWTFTATENSEYYLNVIGVDTNNTDTNYTIEIKKN